VTPSVDNVDTVGNLDDLDAPQAQPPGGEESPVRSVSRAVAILDQFSLERPELSFTEISSGIGLTKSTTHRLLGALRHEEMIEFDPTSRRYRLGLRVFRLGSVVSKTMELATRSDSLLEALAEEIGETAFVVVPDGDEALCIRRFDSRSELRVLFLEVGKRQPFNCGAAPRVLLAHCPAQRWDEIVTRHVTAMTEHSLVARTALERDRREIRERGYAVSREDVTLHACAVGAPVCDHTGHVVAAVSLSGIEQRFNPERLPALIDAIVAAGVELSHRLGHVSGAATSRPAVPADGSGGRR
jgi:DNA-binding IclR family transcriptional regulator